MNKTSISICCLTLYGNFLFTVDEHRTNNTLKQLPQVMDTVSWVFDCLEMEDKRNQLLFSEYKLLEPSIRDYIALHFAHTLYLSPLGYNTDFKKQYEDFHLAFKQINYQDLPKDYQAFIKNFLLIYDLYKGDINQLIKKSLANEKKYTDVYQFFTNYATLYDLIIKYYGFDDYFEVYLEPRLSIFKRTHRFYNHKVDYDVQAKEQYYQLMDNIISQHNIMIAVQLQYKILKKEGTDLAQKINIKNFDPSFKYNVQQLILKYKNIFNQMLKKEQLSINDKNFFKEAIAIVQQYEKQITTTSKNKQTYIFYIMQTELYNLCWRYPTINPKLIDHRFWATLTTCHFN